MVSNYCIASQTSAEIESQCAWSQVRKSQFPTHDPMQVSVIICCHNPRVDYLARVLEALKAQTLSTDNWELLVVDNASDEALAGWFDISWHPKARHIQERQLGLTAARLCGIHESLGDLCVFVDDDNVLAKNYLEAALDLAHEYPKIGAF